VDRDWQDVLDAQIYILEEILNDLSPRRNDRHRPTLLETAISDYQFTFNKAIESLVNSDSNRTKSFNDSKPIMVET
jgi:hypothetical protein